MAVGSERYDPMHFIDQHSQSKDDPKGSDGSNKSIDKDILEVLPEIFLLEIISSSEDHRRQQAIEEDLLIEIYLGDIAAEVQDASEKEADDDADARLMQDVDLSRGGGTCLCSQKLPIRL